MPALTVPRMAASTVGAFERIAVASFVDEPNRFRSHRIAVRTFACSSGVRSDECCVSERERGRFQVTRSLRIVMAGDGTGAAKLLSFQIRPLPNVCIRRLQLESTRI